MLCHQHKKKTPEGTWQCEECETAMAEDVIKNMPEQECNKWEYKIRNKKDWEIEIVLNEMGREGWELVAVDDRKIWDETPEDASVGLLMIFKRTLK